MSKFFVIIWAMSMAVASLWPTTAIAACQTTDKVVLGSWPGNLGQIKIFAAENLRDEKGFTAAQRHCLDLEVAPFSDISQFDIALQQGVPDAVFVTTDLNSFAINRSRIIATGSGERAVIVSPLSNATYGLFARKGHKLGAGSRIATTRCGWSDRELTTALLPEEATEALSSPTLVMLPWLRAQGHRIWCGMTPPADFAGVQLVPIGPAGKRDAAFADPQNGIDVMVQTTERATVRSVGNEAELDLLAGPEMLRPFPESLLVARESCLKDAACADVVKRLVMVLEESRVALLEGGATLVAATIRDFAAEAGEKSSIKGAQDEGVSNTLAQYLIETDLTQQHLSRTSLLEIIDDNGWKGVEPEDLVSSFTVLE